MRQESRTENELRRINLTKLSKQHQEIRLERFPPECRGKEGYNYKIEHVIQKREQRSYFSKEEIRKITSEATVKATT